MSINGALSIFPEVYPNASRGKFAGNAVAEFIRKDVHDVIQAIIGDNGRCAILFGGILHGQILYGIE